MKLKAIQFCIALSLAQTAISFNQRFFVVSFPKCGTHLVAELLKRLTGRNYVAPRHFFQFDINEIILASQNSFYISHAPCTKAALQAIAKENIKGIFIYRDIRDTLPSAVQWIYDPTSRWPHLSKLNPDQIMLRLISHYNSFGPFPDLPHTYRPPRSIVHAFRQYLPWRNSPHIYTTSFEALVGPRGGGSLHVQLKEIKNIATHLQIKIPDEEIVQIAQELFGSGGTFKNGQIRSWPKYLKWQHITALKTVGVDRLLIELGYESDSFWH